MMFDHTTHAAPPQAASARLQAPEPPGSFATDFRRDSEFVQMLRGFRSSGGLARQSEVLRLLALRCPGAEKALAAWMESGHVCSLVWGGQTWLPMFQFTVQDMLPEPALRAVTEELAPAFVGWDACRWFSEPHAALGGQRPAQLLARAPEALCQAARADRYAVLG